MRLPADDASNSNTVTIVGAGLAGSMLALLLANDGERVRLIEKRDDIRIEHQKQLEDSSMGLLTNTTKRSINLALSHRGICALKAAGVYERVQPLLIPMKGRTIHAVNGHTNFQPYGHSHQAIYSVPRLQLNAFLLEELEKLPNIEVMFNTKLERAMASGEVRVRDSDGNVNTFASKALIGADGAFSSVRDCLTKTSRMDFQQTFLEWGYKELTIPPTKLDEFRLSNHESLHIWPRHSFMMIALPNPDKTFTATLFAPWEGEDGLHSLNNATKVESYFRRHFPDAFDLIPDLVENVISAPSSPLLTVVCKPWNMQRSVLIGDAAHAATPFYGQGMNSAFEDALLMLEIWREKDAKNKESVAEVLQEFNARRQEAGVALGQLSLHNQMEMASGTASTLYLFKKKVESVLHTLMPKTWVPLYTMVSFTRTPYNEAQQKAHRQDRILKAVGYTSVVSGLAAAAVLGIKLAQKYHQ